MILKKVENELELLLLQCLIPECRGRSFTADRSSPLTTTVDWQSVK